MLSSTERSIQKIAVFRALKLGDVLLAVPAFRALRAAFPAAQIDYIGLSWAEELAKRFSDYINNFVSFPGYPGLPERPYDPGEVAEFLKDMQSRRYDLVLQMHGSGSIVNPCVLLFGAGMTAGFYEDGGFCPDAAKFMKYPESAHEIHRHLQLMEFLGIRQQGDVLEFPVFESDTTRLRTLYAPGAHRYAVLHPGSVSGGRWPVEQFAALADYLHGKGLQVVVTGSDTEVDIAKHVASISSAKVVQLAGKTDLGSLAALLQGSTLVASNDTGVAHMAVAVDAPSITIFTTADPKRWAPLDKTRHPHLTLDQADYASVTDLADKLLNGR